MAGSRHPASKVRGGQEKPPRARGQGAVTLRSHPEPEARGSSWEEPPIPEAMDSGPEEQPEEWWLRRRRKAWRSYPTLKVRNCGDKEIPLSKVRSSSCALLEQP